MNNFLQSDSCVLIEHKLFFVTNIGNYLLYINMNTGNINFQHAIRLPERIEFITVSNKIIFAFALGGKQMYAIDSEKAVYESISIEGQKGAWGNYRYIGVWDGKIIIILNGVNYIIKIDTQSYEKEKHVFNFRNDQYDILRIIDDNLFFFSSKELNYVKYNLYTNQYVLCSIEKIIESVSKIFIDQKDVIIINGHGEIFRIDINDNTYRCLGKIDNSIVKEIGQFIVANHKVILLPELGKDIYIYDIDKNYLQKYEEYPNDFTINCPLRWAKYTKYFEDKYRYYFSNRCSEYFLLIDKKTGYLNWIRCRNVEYSDWIKLLSNEMDSFYRESDMSLRLYLDCIKNCKT